MATIFDFNTPFGMVNSQPNIGPITSVTPQPTKDRTGLATMLIALGGALQGDKDFVQKAIQLREMKESKEKKNQQEQAVKKYIADNPNLAPGMKSLLNVMSPDQVITTLTKTLDPKDTRTAFQKDIQFLQSKGFTIDQAADMLDKGPNINIDTGEKVFQQEAAKSAFKLVEKSQEVVNNFAY